MTTRVGPYDCMDFREAAAYLNRDYYNFRAEYNEPLKVPHLRIGGRVFFLEADLDKWIDAQRRNEVQQDTASVNALKAMELRQQMERQARRS